MAPTAPLNQPPETTPTGPASWGRMVDTALQERGRFQQDPQHLLRSGQLQPQVLCRYAAGQVTTSERRETEAYLTRTPWALERVTALVKGNRPSAASPLATTILSAAKGGEVSPYRIVAQLLLTSLDQPELARSIERQDQPQLEDAVPLVRAACLLGSDQRDQARDAFAALTDAPDSPWTDLAKQVVDQDEDEALVSLLTAV